MRLIRVLAIVLALGGAMPVQLFLQPFAIQLSAQQPPQPAQDEFVPIDQLPPEAELPAAPMVIAAYMFVWVAFIAYVFTLVRRVKKVESDVARLERERR